MIGKLLKYEFRYMIKDFARIYVGYGVLVLILAIMTGVLKGSPNEGFVFMALFTSLVTIYAVFTFILAFLTITHNVKRFRINMFSREGYLTNTLPVTPEQHIVAKVIAGAVNFIISYVVIILGLSLLFSGDQSFNLIQELFDEIFESIKNGLLLPMFLMTATGYLAVLLCGYLSSALRSMIGGNKGKGSLLVIGMIFGYLFIIIMITATMESRRYSIYGYYRNPVSATAFRYYIFSLVHTIIAVIEFFSITHIIKNRLNLQ